MALTAPVRVAGPIASHLDSPGPVNSSTTGSFAPTPGALLFVNSTSGEFGGAIGTTSISQSHGGSWSWEQLTQIHESGYSRQAVFYAVVPEGAGSGTITLTYSNDREQVAIDVYEVTGHAGVRQWKMGAGSGTSRSVTLDATPAADSLVFGFTADSYGGASHPNLTPGGGFTELYQTSTPGIADNQSVHAQYRLGGAGTGVSTGGLSGQSYGSGLIAVEIAAASEGGEEHSGPFSIDVEAVLGFTGRKRSAGVLTLTTGGAVAGGATTGRRGLVDLDAELEVLLAGLRSADGTVDLALVVEAFAAGRVGHGGPVDVALVAELVAEGLAARVTSADLGATVELVADGSRHQLGRLPLPVAADLAAWGARTAGGEVSLGTVLSTVFTGRAVVAGAGRLDLDVLAALLFAGRRGAAGAFAVDELVAWEAAGVRHAGGLLDLAAMAELEFTGSGRETGGGGLVVDTAVLVALAGRRTTRGMFGVDVEATVSAAGRRHAAGRLLLGVVGLVLAAGRQAVPYDPGVPLRLTLRAPSTSARLRAPSSSTRLRAPAHGDVMREGR